VDFDPLTFHANTDFVASHQYELMLWTHSGAQDDWSGATLQLTGLEVVPEPSTTAVLSVGTVLLIYRQRRR